MKQYTKQQIEQYIPKIYQCHWFQEWIDEVKAPQEYLGRLAILEVTNRKDKAPKTRWTTEGIDFEIVE
jgi:hypothetical protein